MDAVKLILSGLKVDRRRIYDFFQECGAGINDEKNDVVLPLNPVDLFFNNKKTDSSRIVEAELSKILDLSIKRTTDGKSHKKKIVIDEVDDTPTPSNEFTDVAKCHEFRQKHDMRTYGNILQKIAREQLKECGNEFEPPIRNFSDLAEHLEVPKWLVRNLTEAYGFKTPTPVQMQAIPTLLSGKSLVISAPTGSGKTVAFLVPLLTLLKEPGKQCIRALVIVPSRELAAQTIACFERLRGSKKFRGVLLSRSSATALGAKKPRIDLCVTAPLKLAQMLRDGLTSLDDCSRLVLDEADKLLDLGFAPQLDFIFSQLKQKDGREQQVVFLSATLPQRVLELAHSIIPQAVKISIGKKLAAPQNIQQSLIYAGDEAGKLVAFRSLLAEGKLKAPVLIFTSSIDCATKLFKELIFEKQIIVDVMHGERSAAEREQLVQAFRNGEIWILICSDLMARGVDFHEVNVVINWDFPKDSETYIHRIGRTGRAGRKGKAMTFFTSEDVSKLQRVLHVMKQSGCEIPEWMQKLRFARGSKRKAKNEIQNSSKRSKTIF